MKDRQLLPGIIAIVLANTAHAQIAGEYVTKEFLSGHATLHISVQQNGRDVSISFRGDHVNPNSAGPRGSGTGRGDNKAAYFEFKDSCGNTGSGVVSRLRDNRVLLSMRAKHIADFSCLIFYQHNLRLQPADKK